MTMWVNTYLTLKEEITRNIRHEVDHRRLTYDDLVELTGLSRSSVQRIVTGSYKRLSFPLLVQFCQGLNLTLTITVTQKE